MSYTLLDHPCCDGLVGCLVYEDETSGRSVSSIRIDQERMHRPDRYFCYIIYGNSGVGTISMHRIDVDLVMDRLDDTASLLGGVDKCIRASCHQRQSVKPTDHHVDILDDIWLVVGSDNHIASTHIQIIMERHHHRHRSKCFVDLLVSKLDRIDRTRKS